MRRRSDGFALSPLCLCTRFYPLQEALRSWGLVCWLLAPRSFCARWWCVGVRRPARPDGIASIDPWWPTANSKPRNIVLYMDRHVDGAVNRGRALSQTPCGVTGVCGTIDNNTAHNEAI